MQQYLDLLKDVLENGVDTEDRTGTGIRSVFGRQARFNLQDGFPLLTTKKLHLDSIIYELLWFMRGGTNIKYLNDHGVTIWNEWADENGNLGPIYGKQWRNWNGKDQIKELIENLKTNPYSRRHVISSWNVGDLDDMVLHPCHCLFQFYVAPPVDGGKPRLSLQLYQRSADLFLGVPFNIASYALLLIMVAQVVDMDAHEFIHTFGNLHLYDNHVQQAELQLTREPRKLPDLIVDSSVKDIDAFDREHFALQGYDPHPHIKAKVAV